MSLSPTSSALLSVYHLQSITKFTTFSSMEIRDLLVCILCAVAILLSLSQDGELTLTQSWYHDLHGGSSSSSPSSSPSSSSSKSGDAKASSTGYFSQSSMWEMASSYENGHGPTENEKIPPPIITDIDGDSFNEMIIVTREPKLKILQLRPDKNSAFRTTGDASSNSEFNLSPEDDDHDTLVVRASVSLLSLVRVVAGRQVIALQTGYIDALDLTSTTVRRQIVVVVTENLNVLCFDHSLKLLWQRSIDPHEKIVRKVEEGVDRPAMSAEEMEKEESKQKKAASEKEAEAGQSSGGFGGVHNHHLFPGEIAITISSHSVRNGDNGLVIIGGRYHRYSKEEESADLDLHADETEYDSRGAAINAETKGGGGGEKNGEEKWAESIEYHDATNDFQQAQHFSVFAYEAGAGALRWIHDGGLKVHQFQQPVAAAHERYDHTSPPSWRKTVASQSSQVSSFRVDWRPYRYSLIQTLPHLWSHRQDTRFLLAHMEKRRSGQKRASVMMSAATLDGVGRGDPTSTLPNKQHEAHAYMSNQAGVLLDRFVNAAPALGKAAGKVRQGMEASSSSTYDSVGMSSSPAATAPARGSSNTNVRGLSALDYYRHLDNSHPHSDDEHVVKPNSIVCHVQNGLKVLNLYTGQLITQVALHAGAVHVDVDADGVIDHVEGFGGVSKEELYSGGGALSCLGVVSSAIPITEHLFNGTICRHNSLGASSLSKRLKRGLGSTDEDNTPVFAAEPAVLPRWSYFSHDASSASTSVKKVKAATRGPSSPSQTSDHLDKDPPALVYDSLFLVSTGEITSMAPDGAHNWKAETASSWGPDYEQQRSVKRKARSTRELSKDELIGMRLTEKALLPSLTDYAYTSDVMAHAVIAVGRGDVTVLDRDGTVLHEHALDPWDVIMMKPVVGDFSNDGIHDIILISTRGIHGFVVHRQLASRLFSFLVFCLVLMMVVVLARKLMEGKTNSKAMSIAALGKSGSGGQQAYRDISRNPFARPVLEDAYTTPTTRKDE